MKRPTPLTRSPMKPRREYKPVRAYLKRKKRSPAEFERVYGSPERVIHVESQPCVHCGVEGFSVNAHVGTEGKGAGRKANADQIAPLCGSRIGQVGCHELFDQHQAPFDTEEARARIVACAAVTEQRWRERQGAA